MDITKFLSDNDASVKSILVATQIWMAWRYHRLQRSHSELDQLIKRSEIRGLNIGSLITQVNMDSIAITLPIYNRGKRPVIIKHLLIECSLDRGFSNEKIEIHHGDIDDIAGDSSYEVNDLLHFSCEADESVGPQLITISASLTCLFVDDSEGQYNVVWTTPYRRNSLRESASLRRFDKSVRAPRKKVRFQLNLPKITSHVNTVWDVVEERSERHDAG